MRLPRWIHHAYAWVGAYFWMPCPLCGKHFGGHEWRDIDGLPSSIPDPDDGSSAQIGICPDCTRQGLGRRMWQS